MFQKLNFRSKKGMSLAVSLVICLFLILVTGGITTVAMIQQSETGSNMNSRQAYISAKSGLDTIQDALNEKKLTGAQLPGDGDEKYYIFYYDGAGNLQYDIRHSEQDARNRAKDIAENFTAWTLVGGEGTYFKIENDGGKLKVTALNVTGKYNNNVSLNRGDLSFDAIIMNKYYVTLKPTPTTPTTPSGTTPTTPSGTTPTTPTTVIDPPTDVPLGGIGGRFIMIGQQTCLNDANNFLSAGNGQSESAFKTLNQYAKHNNNVYYIGYNFDNRTDVPIDQQNYAYSYFPIVYDKMVEWTSSTDRASLTAFNEGIYYLGEGTHKDDPFSRYSSVSSITQNTSFNPEIRCKFLCIENNFISKAKSVAFTPKVVYAGEGSCDYVVAYLHNYVNFYTIDENNNQIGWFEKSPGYYKIRSGSNICDPSTWNTPITDANERQKWEDFNLYDTIVALETDGKIHSGCNETETDPSSGDVIKITSNGGKIAVGGGSETGYSSTESFTYSNGRENHHIFLAPNTAIESSGYYHWYAGKSFNFQWFRQFDLTVASGSHVIMSAPSIVLTIGPQVTGVNGTPVSVSNKIVEQGNGSSASWKLYGDKGQEAPVTLKVMCSFVVNYDGGKEYTVIQGSYTNVPVGLDLFSEEGRKYFREDAEIHSITDPDVIIKPANVTLKTTSSSTSLSSFTSSNTVMPASINTQTSKVANLFSRLTNGFRLAPMGVYEVSPDVTGGSVASISAFYDTEIVVPDTINSLIYTGAEVDTGSGKVQKINLGTDSVTIKKEIGGVAYDYITFDTLGRGTEFVIPVIAGYDLDLLKPDAANMLIDRANNTAAGANYEVTVTTDDVQILEEYY